MHPWSPRALRHVLHDGLGALKSAYTALADGSLYWSADRPAPGWRRHGTSPRQVLDLRDGALVSVTVHQQRWFRPGVGTRLDPAPDLLGQLRFTLVVIVAGLAGWLGSNQGLHTHEPLVDALRDRPSTRTLQRWRHRLAPHGADLEQAVRTVWLETQPRQAGDAFPCGVPPPMRPGPWRDREMVCRLTAALSMVLGFAIVSNQAVASLLAEAKRRLPTNPFFTA